MTAMTISDLRPAGHALLADSEGFISDLSDEELGIRGAWHVSHLSQPASMSAFAPASASNSADSNSDSNSASAPNSASNAGNSASVYDSDYSASASHGSHYSMPQPHNSSCF